MERVMILLAVLAATAALGAWWNARDGRVRRVTPVDGDPTATVAADLAASIYDSLRSGQDLAFVEFTAPNCLPCRLTGEVLRAVTADRPRVAVRTLDVGDALDLVRAHNILRAPTTLLISAEGTLFARISGVPDAGELTAALHELDAGVAGRPGRCAHRPAPAARRP